MIQIYIDESGDIGYSKKSSRHFVVCAVVVEDATILRRIARDVHRKKSNRKKGNMLHAYAESAVTRDRLVRKLTAIDITCCAWIMHKQDIKVPDLYTYAMHRIAEYFANQEVEIVIIAKRDTRKSYNQKIMEIYQSYGIRIVFSDPAKDKSLQIADFYSWSVFSMSEKGDDEYYKKLSKNIIFP